MTNMTARLILMNPVGYYVFRISFIDLAVTISTFWPVFHLIPSGIFLSIAMHLFAGVALVAFHVLLSVHTRLSPLMLTKILFLYATPVARSADRLHRWFPLKQVTIQKSSFNGIRSADVALPATAVTLIAMGVHCASQFVADHSIWIGPCIHY